MQDFLVYYSIIIFVFIGSTNWNLKEKISNKLIIYGFFPSLSSVVVILLNLYSYEVFFFIMIIFIFQLFIDNFIYVKKSERKIFFLLRIPLTFIILLSLGLIQL